MLAPLIAALLAALPLQQHAAADELQTALLTLRHGKPGEVAFEAALPRIPEMLASASSELVRGAAYVAGEHQRKECAPALIDALKRANAAPPDEKEEVRRAVLDGLIRVDAQVPLDVLFARPNVRIGPQLYVLVDRASERRLEGLSRILALGWTDQDAHWAAACALAHARDPRVSEALLVSLPWELCIVVLSDAEPPARLAASTHLNVAGPDKGWPPSAVYTLRMPDEDGALQPIGYVRSEPGHSGFQEAAWSSEKRALWRVRLLDRLLGDAPERNTLWPKEELRHPFRDVPRYLRAVDLDIEDLTARIEGVALALERQKLFFDAKSLRTRMRLVVTIRDARGTPADPPQLPKPEDRANVKFSMK